ncbi:hypothetical protein BDR22DRAFT_832626 [Usnea florida]
MPSVLGTPRRHCSTKLADTWETGPDVWRACTRSVGSVKLTMLGDLQSSGPPRMPIDSPQSQTSPSLNAYPASPLLLSLASPSSLTCQYHALQEPPFSIPIVTSRRQNHSKPPSVRQSVSLAMLEFHFYICCCGDWLRKVCTELPWKYALSVIVHGRTLVVRSS